MFGGDPCPGTRKYVEVHYECVNSNSNNINNNNKEQKSSKDSNNQQRRLPGWLAESGALDLWQEEENLDVASYDSDEDESDYDSSAEKPKPILVAAEERKPILVEPTTQPPLRIPITTPKVEISDDSSLGKSNSNKKPKTTQRSNSSTNSKRGKKKSYLFLSFKMSFCGCEVGVNDA